MAKQRDYRAEYRRRVERAKASGYRSYAAKRAGKAPVRPPAPGSSATSSGGQRRTFTFGKSGRFVQIDQGSDDEAKQWRAADRLGKRAGRVELIIERDDGTFRNVGSTDWTFDDVDDLFNWIDDAIDGDNDSGYYGDFSGTVQVVAR